MKHIEEVRKALDKIVDLVPPEKFLGTVLRLKMRQIDAEAALSALEADVKELVEAARFVDTHYSGSLDHRPPYVAKIRAALSKFTEAK